MAGGSLVSEVCRMAAAQSLPTERPKDRIKLKLVPYRDFEGKWIGLWDVYHNGKLVWKIWD